MNKKVNWIIDRYLFDEYEDKLCQTVKDSGMNVTLLDDSNFDMDFTFVDYLKKKYTENDIVFLHGSLQNGRKMLRTSSYPGIYLTLDNYECYNYYGYFGDYLLNSEYVMMGLNDVLRNKDSIFDIFGGDGLFIRPSNGYKTFTGQVLSKKDFDTEFSTLIQSYGGLDINTLVVLSPIQEIDEEYRFIVIDGKIISGSKYMDEKNRTSYVAYYDKLCDNPNAQAFAKSMIDLYQPDKAYTIDVCRVKNGGFKLIELNSFCCANWYGNDLNKIVKAVNELCIKDYNDVFE